MIKSFIDGKWQETNNLFDALQFNQRQQEVLSVVGAGGKTTVLRRLQMECIKKQLPHVISTTTHMQYERNERFLGHPSLRMLREIFMHCHTVWMGEPVNEWKMKGFSSEFLREVKNLGFWLLLEADGAKHLPVKAPRSQEPVLLKETTTVVNVYGMDGIGKKIQDICFGTEQVCKILGKTKEQILEEKDLILLATSPLAGKKGVMDCMKYHVILNKTDTEKEYEIAKTIARDLGKQGISYVHATSQLMEKKEKKE